MAVIEVGAATETEMKERKIRIEDALSATRAAVEEGLPRGSTYRRYQILDDLENEIGGDEFTG